MLQKTPLRVEKSNVWKPFAAVLSHRGSLLVINLDEKESPQLGYNLRRGKGI